MLLYIGEMVATPRRMAFMDSISNGLDSATTYDIIHCARASSHIFQNTCAISLLQVSGHRFLSFYLFIYIIVICLL